MRLKFWDILLSLVWFACLAVLICLLKLAYTKPYISIHHLSGLMFYEALKGLANPLIRYIISAGLFWVGFWVVLQQWFYPKKIQKKTLPLHNYFRDIINSLINICTLSVLGIGLIIVGVSDYCQLYADINQYGFWYLPVSFILAAILIDTYYYWLHRLLHNRRLFKLAHRIHHMARIPTPWTTFAISPLEQAFVTLFFACLICTIPMHITVFKIFVLVGLIRQVVGHLGYEVFPKNTLKGWLRWNTTVTHHDMHHEYINCNYALYFIFWDKLMDTLHPNYEQHFNKLFERETKDAGRTIARETV